MEKQNRRWQPAPPRPQASQKRPHRRPTLQPADEPDGPPALTDSVVALPGVSEQFAVALGKGLGVFTVGDLLRHYPRRYEDRTHFKPICDIRHGESVTISGKVISVENIPTRTRVTLTKVAIDDRTGIAFLVFFNQWYLKKQFDKLRGKTIVVYGKASRSGRGGLDMTDVEWEAPEDDKDALSSGRIVPVYPLTEGVLQARVRRAVWGALEAYGDLVEETLPPGLRERRTSVAAGRSLPPHPLPRVGRGPAGRPAPVRL